MNSAFSTLSRLHRFGIFTRLSIHFGRNTLSCLSAAMLVWLGLVVTAAPVAAEIYESTNHKAIFRYRTYSGSRPSWVSPLTGSGGISHSSGSGDIVTINRGTGFANTIVTDFDGSSEFEQGSSSLNVTDSSGHDSFAVEAWFKADSVSGTSSLFSNTESNTGFALKIDDGILRGTVRFNNGGSKVSQFVEQDIGSVTAGTWYYAVFHVKENTSASRYELRLYLDGIRVGYKEVSHYDSVYDSTILPVVGAEAGGGTATGDYFNGQIYAVTVSNHAIYLDNYVRNRVVRDAGRYFGSPSYHDYLDTRAGYDYRVHKTTVAYADVGAQVEDRMQVPFLNDSYIPQGVAYDPATDYFYLSYYWKAADGTTGTYPSIICEIDGSTNTLRRTMQLKTYGGAWNYGHTHGLAFLNGNIYMPYGDTIYRYDLDAISTSYVFNPDTFANPRGDQIPWTPAGSYHIDMEDNTGIGSCEISVDSDGTPLIWVTDFDVSAYTDIMGYPVSPTTGAITLTASYVFKKPVVKVQGVACYSASSTQMKFYLSQSYGDVASKLYDVTYSKSSYTHSSLSTAFTGPAGMEDLALDGAYVWSVSESGASYFQKRADGGTRWEDLYPYLFKINP